LLQKLRNFSETFRPAGRENHHCTWMAGQYILEGAQQQTFFAFHRTATDHDRPHRGLLKGGTQAGDNRRSVWQGYIKLQIAAYLHALRGRANVA
jgi:hypothetical protein